MSINLLLDPLTELKLKRAKLVKDLEKNRLNSKLYVQIAILDNQISDFEITRPTVLYRDIIEK